MQNAHGSQEQRSSEKSGTGLESRGTSEWPKDRSSQSGDWHGGEDQSPSRKSQRPEEMASAKKKRADIDFNENEDIEANPRDARAIVLPPLSRQRNSMQREALPACESSMCSEADEGKAVQSTKDD